MIDNKKIGVIILAAGASSRLGHPKQLVVFKERPLLQQVIDVADFFDFDSEVLVLGANSEKIIESIDQGNFKIIINKNWMEGMSTSIRAGLAESLELEKNLEHILVLVSDQPFVSSENIEELIDVQLNGNNLATFSEYVGELGVPAIFSREVFSKLEQLEGDQGAKKLILNGEIEYETVKFEAGNFDVDTKEDVELLRQMENK